MFQATKLIKPVCAAITNNGRFKISNRTFLSQAYYCNEVWSNRLKNSYAANVNLDEMYQELDQRYQRNGLISAVDVDVFVNSVNEDTFTDEILDLTHKLRLSAETSNTLNSTSHAVIRFLLEHNKKEELVSALDDRLNYGLFIDYYTANILMDKFYKHQDFASGARVGSQLMLQEETNHPLSSSLTLLHCYNYLVNPVGWIEPTKPEEPEEEVKVRVKYLRNPYDDDHFDLRDPKKIVGKTLMAFTKGTKDPLQKSLQLLGLVLYNKEEKAQKLLQQNNDKLYKDILDLVPEECSLKAELQKLQLDSNNVQKLLETSVKEAEREIAEKDVAAQCSAYSKWEQERTEALDRQKERLLRASRIANIEEKQEEMKTKEEKLWFFENEEKIELEIEEKQGLKPKKDRSKPPGKIDENYVPPEV